MKLYNDQLIFTCTDIQNAVVYHPYILNTLFKRQFLHPSIEIKNYNCFLKLHQKQEMSCESQLFILAVKVIDHLHVKFSLWSHINSEIKREIMFSSKITRERKLFSSSMRERRHVYY